MKNPWGNIKIPARDVSALRIDSEHPLDLYWAKDHVGRYLLVYEYPINSNVIIKNPPNLEGIEAVANQAPKDKSRLILILKEKENWELFYSLCFDLLRATEATKTAETASGIILTRLRRWQRFLKKKRPNILPEEKIKGLIGELLFLRDNLIPRYGCTDAVKFWQGPEGSPQDFNINQLAVEVKCQMGGSKPSIRVSSVDQLHSQLPQLFLYVVTLGKSDIDNKDSINLNELVSQIEMMLNEESSSSIGRFEELIVEVGYIYNEKYNAFNYILTSSQVFKVFEDFPRIIAADIKHGITKVQYEISLASCAPFEIEFKEWDY